MAASPDVAFPRRSGHCNWVSVVLRFYTVLVTMAAMGILMYRIDFFQSNAPASGNGSVELRIQAGDDKIKFMWYGFASNLCSVVGMVVTSLAYYGVARFRGSRRIALLSTSRRFLGALLMSLAIPAIVLWLIVFSRTIGNAQFVKSGIDIATAIVVGSQLLYALGCFQRIAGFFPSTMDVMKGGEDAHIRGAAAHEEYFAYYKLKSLVEYNEPPVPVFGQVGSGRLHVSGWQFPEAPLAQPTYHRRDEEEPGRV